MNDSSNNALNFYFISSDNRYSQLKELSLNQLNNLKLLKDPSSLIGFKNYNSKGGDRNGDGIAENSLVVVNGQKLLEIINYPDPALDWIGALIQYQKNFDNSLVSQDSLYMWGQQSELHHESMCSNCGYILEVLEGGTYPICPACQAGTPDSPSSPDNPFWKNLT